MDPELDDEVSRGGLEGRLEPSLQEAHGHAGVFGHGRNRDILLVVRFEIVDDRHEVEVGLEGGASAFIAPNRAAEAGDIAVMGIEWYLICDIPLGFSQLIGEELHDAE